MFYSFPSIYCLKWIVQVLRPTDACIMSLYCYLKPRDKSKFSFPRRQRLKPLFWNNGFMLRVFGVVWDASDTIVFTQQIQSSHMYVSPQETMCYFLVLLWPWINTLYRLNFFFFTQLSTHQNFRSHFILCP